MAKRVAFYLRVSTGDGQQTIENQRRALDEIAQRACWEVVESYADEISGTKGRERRPAFDRMLKAAVRRKFDMIAAWSTVATRPRCISGRAEGRQCRPVPEPTGARHIDAIGPALFQMLGIFAEFGPR
jgi:hypothetical protein